MSTRCLFAVAVGVALAAGAGPSSAAEPKAGVPDLTDLKDAVARADRRGENVGTIQDALAAFEKALAKGAIKPGEAPPELTALREAVEAAAKKGENVEAIGKELGRIEKALTGREYERPKPEPKPEPAPVPPLRRPGVVMNGGIAIAGGANNSTRVSVSNGNFTIVHRQNEATYVIGGKVGANGPEVARLLIVTGDKRVNADSLEKVPDEFKPTVERLLKMVSR